MTTEIRKKVLHLIEEATHYAYPVRWADATTTRGDFDGRDVTIDIFSIATPDQVTFLATIRPFRDHIRELIGRNCIFIFHSPEATLLHYSHLFPVTHGIQISKGEIKFALPEPGGTDGKPEVIGSLEILLEAT